MRAVLSEIRAAIQFHFEGLASEGLVVLASSSSVEGVQASGLMPFTVSQPGQLARSLDVEQGVGQSLQVLRWQRLNRSDPGCGRLRAHRSQLRRLTALRTGRHTHCAVGSSAGGSGAHLPRPVLKFTLAWETPLGKGVVRSPEETGPCGATRRGSAGSHRS